MANSCGASTATGVEACLYCFEVLGIIFIFYLMKLHYVLEKSTCFCIYTVFWQKWIFSKRKICIRHISRGSIYWKLMLSFLKRAKPPRDFDWLVKQRLCFYDQIAAGKKIHKKKPHYLWQTPICKDQVYFKMCHFNCKMSYILL